MLKGWWVSLGKHPAQRVQMCASKRVSFLEIQKNVSWNKIKELTESRTLYKESSIVCRKE